MALVHCAEMNTEDSYIQKKLDVVNEHRDDSTGT
jgi:hypothetical protein